MTPERWETVVRAFEAALERAPGERRTFLDGVCAGDADLRADVASLLAAHDGASGFLEAAAPRAAAVVDALRPDPGDTSPGVRDPTLAGRLQTALGDAYRVERELEGGGMSRVFVAQEVALGRRVAVKVVLPPEPGAAFNVARFRREVRLAATLRHPHIVPLLTAGESADGLVYYTMPFVEGESLKQRLERAGTLPLDAVVRLVTEVADALAYAHRRGVIHRDVKPANILVDEDHALVADFGIATARTAAIDDGADAAPPAPASPLPTPCPRAVPPRPDPAVLTAHGLVLGTPAYISPEQAGGDRPVDARTDVYSLGCVAYEMLAGAPPSAGGGPAGTPLVHAHRPDAPPGVGPVIAKALAPRPDDRWATPTAFARALAVASAPAPAASRPGWRQWRARAASVGVIGAATFAAARALSIAGARPRGDVRPHGSVPAASPADAATRPTGNFEAYNYFLRAEALRANTSAERASRAQAVALYERATALDPRFALAFARLAEVQSLIYWSYTDRSPGRLARVEAAARTAVRLAPELPEAHLALAAYYYRARRDYDRALAELAVAIARAPNRADLLAWRGLIERRAGRFSDALEALRRADELDPGSPERAADVAVTYALTRAYPDAMRYYTRVRTLAPTWATGHAAQAEAVLAWRGDLATARRTIHDGIWASDPGQIVAELGYLSPALVAPGADTRAVLRAVPHAFNSRDAYLLWCAEWWIQRGPAAKGRAYADSARASLEAAVRAHPDEAGLYDHLALADAYLGRKADALRESDRALALLPVSRDAYDGASFLEDRAYLDTRLGEFGDAVARLRVLLAVPSAVSVPLLRAAPVWAPLRADPRFRQLIGGDR